MGVITAMEEELNAIKSKLSNIQEISIFDIVFYKGIKSEKKYILCKSGVGKVNSARTAQILADNFKLDYIVNIGSAGALNDNLQIGDIVIGKNLVQHDFDITAFGHEKGYITDTGKIFKSDLSLINKYEGYIKNNNLQYRGVIGTIASGDIFCTNVDMKNKIKQKFNADCVEMEGAAIAQVCTLNNIPFLGIRSISDTPNGNNQIDFNKFLELASERCATLLTQI
ncbi:MAG: 5'-methylthioadenosine/adenosylhomocysteine nucleosidase [Clostridia bacterium]|nr:5'-methylthioadenosine/adenosylhomocysteine nucleosidase [Clostridia bacterium]